MSSNADASSIGGNWSKLKQSWPLNIDSHKSKSSSLENFSLLLNKSVSELQEDRDDDAGFSLASIFCREGEIKGISPKAYLVAAC